jgi:hypothetical protein
VTLNAPAPAGGTVVTLTNGRPDVATIPASVTVPAGAMSATFTITATSSLGSWVGRAGDLVTANAGGVRRALDFEVNYPDPAVTTSEVRSVSFTPWVVTGGQSATATVTLGGLAPAGGAVVTLQSGNTSVATVPVNVTVPAGQRTATFTVTTLPVGAAAWGTISAIYGGATVSNGLRVNAAPVAAPRVSGVQVNVGQSDPTQRSRVTSVTVTFSTAVTFADPSNVAAAFGLSRVGGGAVGGFTASASLLNGATVVTLSGFTGAETEFGSLADGRYSLTVRAGQVTAGGQQLDGDGNGTGGDDYTLAGSVGNGLFRLYGDVSGDGTVNAFDFGQFRPAFGSSSGQAAYRDYLDIDADGSINAFDFGRFRNRFGSAVP